ncbi:MAG: HEPN domain-containing protein [bacterium]
MPKSDYGAYLKKSSDFYKGMHASFARENWNSVGLEAVHCAISCNDAILSFFTGERSKKQDHREAVGLLIKAVGTDESKKAAEHLRKVISLKNLIEYENRSFTKTEAENIIKHADRFYEWAKSILPT